MAKNAFVSIRLGEASGSRTGIWLILTAPYWQNVISQDNRHLWSNIKVKHFQHGAGMFCVCVTVLLVLVRRSLMLNTCLESLLSSDCEKPCIMLFFVIDSGQEKQPNMTLYYFN